MLKNHTCQHNHSNGNGSHRCISIVPIFNHLEESQMDEILGTVHSTSFKKGEIIYHQGEPSDSLYVVHSGKVRIYRLSESGKEQIVRILNPGDFTGELALFKEGIHESFAEAMVHTDICLINRNDLQEFLLKYPTISMKILTEFSNRLEDPKYKQPGLRQKKWKQELPYF